MSIKEFPEHYICPTLVYENYEQKHGYRPERYEDLPEQNFENYMKQTELSDVTLMVNFCAKIELQMASEKTQRSVL